MGNAVHSAIRESIHSVTYVCINRLMNFVNQNKTKEIGRGVTWKDLDRRYWCPALADADNYLTRRHLMVREQRKPTKFSEQLVKTPGSNQGNYGPL